MSQEEPTTTDQTAAGSGETFKTSQEEATKAPSNGNSKTEGEGFDYKDKYLRLLADVENTRKRMQKEKQETMRFAIDNLLTDIIAPVDSFENALKLTDQMPEEVRNWAIGFGMILSQFKEVLLQNGVSSFESKGRMFDPSKHEAVEMDESSELPEGTITHEFIKGYQSGNRIIRAARVKVAKKTSTKVKGETSHEL